MQKSLRTYTRILGAGLLSLATLQGEARAESSELQVRLGGFLSSYSGPIEGTVVVPTSIDVDYGTFLSTKKSLNFRSILAMEFPSAKPYYVFAGAGMRFFFNSQAMPTYAEDNGTSISIESPWRYYLGFDAGISQVIVQSFGRVLQATSTMIEFSGNIGCVYQVDRRVGIAGQLALGTGYGFSSISVYAVTAKLLLGVSYLF